MRTYFSIIISVSVLLLAASCSSKRNINGGKKDQSSTTQRVNDQGKQHFENLFYEANKNMMLGKKEEALKNFYECLTLDPNNGACNYQVASLLSERKDLTMAISYVDKAIKSDVKNEWYQLKKAEILKLQGKLEEAAKVYAGLTLLAPRKTSYYLNAAEYYAYAGKYEESLKMFDKIEAMKGVTEDVSIKKESLYLQLGKPEKAKEELQKLMNKFPGNSRYAGMMADLLMQQGKKEEAYQIFKDLIQKNPDDGNAHFSLAEYYRDKGENEKSFSELKEAFRSKSTDIRQKLQVLNSFLPQIDHDAKKKEQAFELAGILVEVHPEDESAHAMYGDFLYRDKQFREAYEQYHIALDNNKNNTNTWQQLLFCDIELKDYARAKTEADEALELFPNQPIFYYFKSTACFQLKEYSCAANMAQAGADINTGSAQMQLQFLSLIGDANHYLKKYDLSDEAFEKALKMDPANALIKNNYAYYLSLRNVHLDRAEVMSKSANELSPNNPAYLDTYGWILFQQKKYAEAKTWIEKAYNLQPKDPDLCEHMGDVMFRLGNINEAVDYWKKAKANGSESQSVDKKINERKLEG